jgi:hypothetical protein
MAAGCRYDEAGPWLGGTKCSGTFYPGTQALGEALVANFGGSYGGYSCRPNTADTSQLSVHGTGRAVDWFPPSKAAGDRGTTWLVQNHIKFGVQLVIWWHEDWSCTALDNVPGVGAGDGWTSYGGPNPHTDHAHVELTVPAAADNTAATYTKELFTVSQFTTLLEQGRRQTEVLSQKIVAQGRMTRDYVDKRFDTLTADGKKLTAVEIAALRSSIEDNADEIMAKIDADNPEPPVDEGGG